jgi:hypothetical protein
MARNYKNIKKLIAALEEFAEVDPKMSLPSILTLLYYADIENNSGNRSIVEERLGMSGATASRATMFWSEWKSPRERGHNMIEMTQDPMNRRANIVQYNRRGLDFINRIEEAME